MNLRVLPTTGSLSDRAKRLRWDERLRRQFRRCRRAEVWSVGERRPYRWRNRPPRQRRVALRCEDYLIWRTMNRRWFRDPRASSPSESLESLAKPAGWPTPRRWHPPAISHSCPVEKLLPPILEAENFFFCLSEVLRFAVVWGVQALKKCSQDS